MNNEQDEVLDTVVYQDQTYNVKYEAGLIYFELVDPGVEDLGLL